MNKLRYGFSTGSAAAAAAKAALLFYYGQRDIQQVNIPLPDGERLDIGIENIQQSKDAVKVTVVKDAGDDPDVTDQARINVCLSLDKTASPNEISIEGGAGVGLVTKPGLPVPVGEPAINPVPREQIKQSVLEVSKDRNLSGKIKIIVSVDNGLALAKKTLNPRLGIVGGLSILGTSGLVHPYSCQAYQETIMAALDVAQASESSVIALSTGGKSERYLKTTIPDLPEECFVQIADFFAFSLEQARQRGFNTICIGCFFGKLVKMAHGYASTHARTALIDFDRLASWCGQAGLEGKKIDSVAQANTAREVLDILDDCRHWNEIINLITMKAKKAATDFFGKTDISFYLFDFQGKLLHFQ